MYLRGTIIRTAHGGDYIVRVDKWETRNRKREYIILGNSQNNPGLDIDKRVICSDVSYPFTADIGFSENYHELRDDKGSYRERLFIFERNDLLHSAQEIQLYLNGQSGFDNATFVSGVGQFQEYGPFFKGIVPWQDGCNLEHGDYFCSLWLNREIREGMGRKKTLEIMAASMDLQPTGPAKRIPDNFNDSTVEKIIAELFAYPFEDVPEDQTLS